MSPCLYHQSDYIPWVHVYTMSPCLYHESFFKSMLSFLYHEKYSFQIYRNTSNKNKEIQVFEFQKYNLEIYRNKNYRNKKILNRRNTTCRSAEIQMAALQKYTWLLNHGWFLNHGWGGYRHTDGQTHRHINTMTRTGLGAAELSPVWKTSQIWELFREHMICMHKKFEFYIPVNVVIRELVGSIEKTHGGEW